MDPRGRVARAPRAMGRALQVAESARTAFPCPHRSRTGRPHLSTTGCPRPFSGCSSSASGLGAGHNDLRTPADRDHRRGRGLEAAVRREPQAGPRGPPTLSPTPNETADAGDQGGGRGGFRVKAGAGGVPTRGAPPPAVRGGAWHPPPSPRTCSQRLHCLPGPAFSSCSASGARPTVADGKPVRVPTAHGQLPGEDPLGEVHPASFVLPPLPPPQREPPVARL